MKHARHVAAGGVVGPLTLASAAAIANEVQTLLGLNLHGEALAIFTAPFLLGAAAIMFAQLRLEGQRLLAELGDGNLDLGDVLSAVGNLFGGGAAPTPTEEVQPVPKQPPDPAPPPPGLAGPPSPPPVP